MIPDEFRRDDLRRSQTKLFLMISDSHGPRWSKFCVGSYAWIIYLRSMGWWGNWPEEKPNVVTVTYWLQMVKNPLGITHLILCSLIPVMVLREPWPSLLTYQDGQTKLSKPVTTDYLWTHAIDSWVKQVQAKRQSLQCKLLATRLKRSWQVNFSATGLSSSR